MGDASAGAGRARGPWIAGAVLLSAAVLGFVLFSAFSRGPGAPKGSAAGSDETHSPTPPEAAPAAPQPTLAVGPPPAARASEPAKEPSAAGAREMHVVGRVLREGRPAGGVRVTLGFEAESKATSVTDGDGRFSIAVDRPVDPSPSLLVARDDAAHVATTTVWWRPPSSASFVAKPKADPSVIDVGEMSLVDSAGIDVAVSDPRGFAAPGAKVAALSTWSPSPTPLATATADSKGRARLDGLPAGNVTVYAWVEGVGRGVVDAVVPRTDAGPLEIALAPVRTIEVTVVDAAGKSPIAGATVTLTEWIGTQMSHSAPYVPSLLVPPTDAQGRTQLREIARGAKGRVSASAAGYGAAGQGFGDDGVSLPSEATTLEIPLAHVRRVSWPVEAGEVAVPADGTTLQLKPMVGGGRTAITGSARMEAGRVVAEGLMPGYVNAIVVTPDGSQARIWAPADKDEGPAVIFLRPRTARVTVRSADGSPAAGVWVSLRNQGNNPFGPAQQTDAQGVVVFQDLEAQMADVYVAEVSAPWGGRRVASCDLAKGDGTVEVRLPRPREARVRVFLDGKPGLPKDLVPSWGEVKVLERDETEATLRLRVTPPSDAAEVAVAFQAAGWLAKDPVKIPAGRGDEVVEARLDLQRAGGLDVQVIAAKGVSYRLRLEKQDDGGDWTATWFDTQTFGPGQTQVDSEGRWRLKTVPVGRYRVRETYSSAVSEEVVVAAGATGTVRLDVSKSDWVAGRVVVPEGESPEGVVVQIDPPPPTASWASWDGMAHADKEGKFRLRVPGDAPVTIAAHSLFLVPAAEGGTARVAAGTTDVVLRVTKSPVGVVTFDREPSYRMNPGQRHSEAVSMWRGPMRGAPAVKTQALIDGKTARFGSFPAGKWTVMIDVPVCAPVVLPDVELGAGTTDLGTVALSEGTVLVFEVKVPAGQSAPRVSAWARRVDGGPEYQRFGDIGARGRLPGLGAGRFRVTATPVMGGASLFDREIDVDGASEVPLVLEVK